MGATNAFCPSLAAFAVIALGGAWPLPSMAQQNTGSVQVDSDDIGGIVTSANGPEAGVWVIAETDAFKTRYAKIVVTDS
jgi:hypothetical protein